MTSDSPSHIMRAWHGYTARVQKANDAHRYIGRLKDSPGIYLSEATGCPRKATFRLLKYPKPAPNAIRRKAMNAGIKGEEKIAIVLEAERWTLERQVPVVTRYGNGRIDLLAHPPPESDGHAPAPVIIEIKTTELRHLEYLPRREHVDQALIYQGFLYPRDIHPHMDHYDAEVVYLLHDQAAGVEKVAGYPVAWDRDRFEWLVRQLDLIEHNYRHQTPCPIPDAFTQTSIPCQFPNAGKCDYWQHCWGEVPTVAPPEDGPMETF